MVVQIYGVMNAEDGALVAALGADQVGVVVGDRDTAWDAVTFDTANRIFDAVGEKATKVALTLSTSLNEIASVIETIRFDLLHLASGIEHVSAADVGELKRCHPGLRVIRTIPVTGPTAIDAAMAFEDVADYLLLDSRDPDTQVVGATGRPHEWSLSAQIVSAVRRPVILAGGLSPDNVRDAIATVRPWGVDSNTLTSRSDDRTRKDGELVRKFIEAARVPGGSGDCHG
jgi:phosphoribosylanthranilate isomerase